jgi:uncharacterized protein (UPF0332 family)
MDIVKRRIKEAEESISEAEYIYSEKVSNIAVMTKLYQAMIYIIMAMYKIRDIGRFTHADLIEKFEKGYSWKGIVDTRLIEALRHAYNVTHECDCEHMKQPDDKDIETLLPLAKEFVVKIKDKIMKLHDS